MGWGPHWLDGIIYTADIIKHTYTKKEQAELGQELFDADDYMVKLLIKFQEKYGERKFKTCLEK